MAVGLSEKKALSIITICYQKLNIKYYANSDEVRITVGGVYDI